MAREIFRPEFLPYRQEKQMLYQLNTKNMCDPLDIPNQTSFTSDIEKDVGVHNEASDKQNDS
jgi:hypothetical protein